MKGIKPILVFLIIISLCLLVYLVFFVSTIKQFTYEEYKIMQEGENPELAAALKIRIFPENKEYLEEKYAGRLDLNYVYEKLFDLVHTNLESMQNDFSKLTANEYNNYLAQNQAKLVSTIGITSTNQLATLAQNILNKDISDTEYVKTVIFQDTYVESEKYDTVNISINYNNATLYFKLYIANDMITSPMVIFEAINGGAQ